MSKRSATFRKLPASKVVARTSVPVSPALRQHAQAAGRCPQNHVSLLLEMVFEPSASLLPEYAAAAALLRHALAALRPFYLEIPPQ